MAQTIRTKVLPYTNTKPTRVKAISTSGVNITIEASEGGSALDHANACRVLREKLGWLADKGFDAMVGGDTAEGMVWVFVPEDSFHAVDYVNN